MQVTRADSKQFNSYLENAATMGRPMLVEDVAEQFEQTISRLARQMCLKQGEWTLKAGDKELKVADGFRLYVTTRLSRPPLSNDTRAYVDTIDFTLTDDAIFHQLLSCVFQHDKPVSTRSRFNLPTYTSFLIIVAIIKLIIIKPVERGSLTLQCRKY